VFFEKQELSQLQWFIIWQKTALSPQTIIIFHYRIIPECLWDTFYVSDAFSLGVATGRCPAQLTPLLQIKNGQVA